MLRKRIRAQLYPVPGFDGLFVSKDGHAAARSKIYLDFRTGEYAIQYIKQRISKKGYKVITFNRNNYFLHRMMLLTFKPNPKNKPFTNHKDGIRTNNRIENLEWSTQSENELHKIYVLNKDSQLKKRKVAIFLNGIEFKQARSVSEAARLINGNQSNISQCCLGNRQ